VFGFVPVIHQSFFTWADMPAPVRIAIAYMLVMGACYLTVSELAVSEPLLLLLLLLCLLDSLSRTRVERGVKQPPSRSAVG